MNKEDELEDEEEVERVREWEKMMMMIGKYLTKRRD